MMEKRRSAATATEDALLGGRVRLYQPDLGYRTAIDPVLLAAFTAALPGERVLDLGAGTGAAALCLAARVPGVHVIGLEKRPEAAALARRSVELNAFDSRILIVEGDLMRPPPALGPGSFDRVMTNPPYLKAGNVTPSPDPWKAAANVEGEAQLAEWIGFAAAMLKARGWLTLVHRADRLDEIFALLHGRFGNVMVFPLWQRVGEPARRLLLAAQRGANGPATLAYGLVLHLHNETGFTRDAEAVLRDGAPIAFTPPAASR
jgi:tRNA1(Val) A37 N6-methylase TrmN6